MDATVIRFLGHFTDMKEQKVCSEGCPGKPGPGLDREAHAQ